MSEKRTKQGKINKMVYDNQYQREHYKRVALNLKKDFFEKLQKAAERENISVTEYIRNAIEKAMSDS